jgi:outer membrane protein OmpA-like peptidoglycan-associated protein
MEEENSQWINIADVMSALMMIFMFLSVTFIYELQNSRETYRSDLNAALHDEFGKDLERWKAEITPDNIFRFNAPFKSGASRVPDSFGETLTDFFPRYLRVLMSPQFVSNIEELRVEGHTSYGWGSLSSRKKIYLNNMRLSQSRAINVLEYCYNLDNDFVNAAKDWLESRFRSNGMAYSNLIDRSGTVAENFTRSNINTQDKGRSRRVEFKAVVE